MARSAQQARHVEAFMTLHESLKAAREIADRSKLSTLQLATLACIVIKPGITPSELSGELQIEPEVSSRILKALISAKLIQFQTNDQDGRKRHFYLTVFGRNIVIEYLKARKITVEPNEIPIIKILQRTRIEGGLVPNTRTRSRARVPEAPINAKPASISGEAPLRGSN